MITFYELGQLGRLGNQLFQYAALKSLGLERGYEVKIPDPKTRTWHGQQCLLSNFNIESDYFTNKDLQTLSYSYSEPSHEYYDHDFLTLPDNVNISGTTSGPSDTGTNAQGSSSTNTNLPPYHALCFIMKT